MVDKPIPNIVDATSNFIIEMAKSTYPKVIRNDNEIKIKHNWYKITEINNENADKHESLLLAMNDPTKSGKESRMLLYAYLVFMTDIKLEIAKTIDLGELRQMVALLGLMQQGFRGIQ